MAEGVEVRAHVPDMAAVRQAAWACAGPIVSTPLVMNGLALPPGPAGLVQAEAGGIADAVVALLRDGMTRRRLGREARKMVAGDFTWAGAGNRMDALLEL